ncbi:uncharacterized protein PG986_002125 [Apiospora aurea]|uniref:Uncharacterized protein n=1 Tax=Apiospora aurea TaxID=335848 RepID=A0ABR1QZJ6_9PEZI
MFIPKVKLVQAILAFTTTLVAANGCYDGGLVFSDLIGGSVDGDINDFSNKYRGSASPPNAVVTHCYPFPQSGNRLQMSLQNNQGSSQDLRYEDCTRYFGVERTACKHGSEQDHGSFHYYIYPNDGNC